MPTTTATQHYSQGLETYRVPMSLYSTNRQNVVSSLKSVINKKYGPSATSGIILLQGGQQETRHDTDHEPVFRQESYFHYLFGTNLPDCYGAVSFGSELKTVVFVPTWDEEVATVCGESPDFVELAQELGVDEVLGLGSLNGWVEKELGLLTGGAAANGVNGESNGVANGHTMEPKLYLLKGLNTDSGNYARPAYYKGIEEVEKVKDEETLFNCIAECRVHKVSLYLAQLAMCTTLFAGGKIWFKSHPFNIRRHKLKSISCVTPTIFPPKHMSMSCAKHSRE